MPVLALITFTTAFALFGSPPPSQSYSRFIDSISVMPSTIVVSETRYFEESSPRNVPEKWSEVRFQAEQDEGMLVRV